MKILKDLLQLSDGSKSVGLGTVIDGVAKAWARWDMSSTQAFSDSFNVSSLTDGGTGQTKLTLTNAMSSNQYSMSSCVGELAGGGNRGLGMSGADGAISASSVHFRGWNFSSALQDVNFCCAEWKGDLA